MKLVLDTSETKTIPNFFKKRLQENFPSMIIDSGQNYSSQHILQEVLNLIQRFQKEDLEPNEVVGIVGENSLSFILVLLALWQMQIIPMIINPHFSEEQIEALFKKFSINSSIFLSNKQPSFSSFKGKILFKEQLFVPFKGPLSSESLPDRLLEDHPSTVLFTSGSSGEPKAVIHQWKNHFYSAQGIIEAFKIGQQDQWILSLPLFHVGGLGILIRCFLSGASLILPHTTSLPLPELERYPDSFVSLVPTQLWRLWQDERGRNALIRSKGILLGGSAVSETLLRDVINSGIPVYPSYGSTEMSSTITAVLPDDPLEKKFTSGTLLPYRELKIDAEGKIFVRGKTRFYGYWHPESVEMPFDQDGWFFTGDLGEMDEKGFLSIIGRYDNMFISGGENIQPELIEKILTQHPIVEEAVIVPIRDEEYGNRPFAFVRLNRKWDEQAKNILHSFAQKQLPGLWRPIHYVPIPEQLRSGIKYSRKELEKEAEKYGKSK